MSRTKETKLIMESWRKFINEAPSRASDYRYREDKFGKPEGAGVIGKGTPAKEITNPEAKRLPNNFKYNSEGRVVHVDNGEPVNDRHYKDLSEPKEGYKYDEVGNLVPDYTGEAGPEYQMNSREEEFMSKYDDEKLELDTLAYQEDKDDSLEDTYDDDSLDDTYEYDD